MLIETLLKLLLFTRISQYYCVLFQVILLCNFVSLTTALQSSIKFKDDVEQKNDHDQNVFSFLKSPLRNIYVLILFHNRHTSGEFIQSMKLQWYAQNLSLIHI